MTATSPAGTAWRAAPTSRSFSPRPLRQSRFPTWPHPLYRSEQDEYSTPSQNLPWYCLRDILIAYRCCGVRQTIVPVDNFRRCDPLRIADRGHPGGTREFSLPSRGSAALLEVDGRGFVSDAAFAGLLVLL